MKILFVNQFFWPDLAPTSILLSDVARSLSEQGHQVTVLCAGTSYTGQACDASPQPPVRLLRLPAPRFGRSVGGRVLSYAAFFLGTLWKSIWLDKPDAIVTLTTPPLISLVGTVAKKLRGVRFLIWEMDIYPDVAVDLGVMDPRSLLTRLLGRVAGYQRRQADRIIALGECMQERLMQHGIPREKIVVAANWADGRLLRATRPRAGRPITIVYPGNLGMGHDVATIAEVLRRLRFDQRFRFLFIGGGAQYQQLRDFCQQEGITAADFLPYRNPKQLAEENLCDADIGLVTQNMNCAGTIVPSKLYPLMGAGLPVLFIGPGRATPALTVEKYRCGWHFECGEVEGLQTLLLQLACNPEQIREAGARARQAFLDDFDLPRGVARVSAVILNEASYSTVVEVESAEASRSI